MYITISDERGIVEFELSIVRFLIVSNSDMFDESLIVSVDLVVSELSILFESDNVFCFLKYKYPNVTHIVKNIIDKIIFLWIFFNKIHLLSLKVY